jgi:hypothetical protein
LTTKTKNRQESSTGLTTKPKNTEKMEYRINDEDEESSTRIDDEDGESSAGSTTNKTKNRVRDLFV